MTEGRDTVPGARQRSAGTYFPCLDAYRAIGMLMVLVNHAAFSTGFIQRSRGDDATVAQELFAPLIARFDLAVPMFFVLSGFLLYRPYAAGATTGKPGPAITTFYRRRALRILPGYWAALGGLAVFSAVSTAFTLGVDSVWAWIGNLLTLPAFGVPIPRCVDGTCVDGYGITQAWSIGVEVTFYLLLPLWGGATAALVRRRWPGHSTAVLLAGCAALYIVGTAFRVAVVYGVQSEAAIAQTLLWFPMYLDFFAIGMALAVASVALTRRPRLPTAARLAADHPALAWAVAGAIVVAVAQMDPPSVPFGLEGAEYLPRQFAYGVASLLWLAPSIFGDQDRGRLRRFLAHPVLVYLGGISLSFYLWHLAFVEQAKAWLVPNYLEQVAANPLAGFQGPLLGVVAVAFVCTLAVSAVIYRVVELPFLARKPGPTTSPR
ncbi:MAG: acyltransferase [Acidimicrobiia bacterium]|nr:acyltransferase [Acidimicrobiia bacterium]